jgi:hypothetical protein
MQGSSYLRLEPSIRSEFVVGNGPPSYVSTHLRGYFWVSADGRRFKVSISASKPSVDTNELGTEAVRLTGTVEFEPPRIVAGGPGQWPRELSPSYSGAPTFRYDGLTGPPPDGFTLEERPSWGLVGLGAAAFTLSYSASLWAAAESDFTGRGGYLAIPVAGPGIVLADFIKQWRDEGTVYGIFDPLVVGGGLVVLTILQAGGLIGVGVGLVPRPFRWVKDDDSALLVVPLLSTEAAGLSVSHEF